MTKFEAKEIVDRQSTVNGNRTIRTFNLYADGGLCGRLAMPLYQFEEFTERMRAVEYHEHCTHHATQNCDCHRNI